MIAQNKGRDLEDIAKSKLSQGPYFVSRKYDGHYVQIKFDLVTQHVQMWTSGGKEFYLTEMANHIKKVALFSFHIECEYNYSCAGFLGERGKSAILTTYRTNYAKGIETPGDPSKDIFRVLDCVDSDRMFESRLPLCKSFAGEPWFSFVSQVYVSTLDEAQEMAKIFVKEGYEGAMCKAPTHTYVRKDKVSRHNDIVKLKPRRTADLVCIDTQSGEVNGKYENLIGSLILQDKAGRTCKSGSGLSDSERHIDPAWYIGRVIEIEYERIDETYVQPIFKCVRHDKTEEEID